MEVSMVETHHLKAKDFILQSWTDMAFFPQDGRSVEIQDEKSRVFVARWHNGHVHIDSDEQIVPLHWREISQ
jgi:hypothetical protein